MEARQRPTPDRSISPSAPSSIIVFVVVLVVRVTAYYLEEPFGNVAHLGPLVLVVLECQPLSAQFEICEGRCRSLRFRFRSGFSPSTRLTCRWFRFECISHFPCFEPIQ